MAFKDSLNVLEPKPAEMPNIKAFVKKINDYATLAGLSPEQYLKCLSNVMASVVAGHSTINETLWLQDMANLIAQYRTVQTLKKTVGAQ